jgi:hypothetical protein
METAYSSPTPYLANRRTCNLSFMADHAVEKLLFLRESMLRYMSMCLEMTQVSKRSIVG